MITVPTRFESLFSEDGTPTLRGAVWIEEVTGAFNSEDWHLIGGTGEPAFENSWVNYDSGWDVAAFYKDAFSVVHVKGLVKSGTLDSAIFTLPDGYRPSSKQMYAAIQGNDGSVRLQVDATGEVFTNASSSNVFQSIWCSFRV